MTHDMFHYWKLIFDFQLLILQFVRAERETNFLLHVHVLNLSMKYIFAINHYNYARWLSVHVDNLTRLDVSTSIQWISFRAFCNPFSAVSLDLGHEQNDATIKGAGEVIALLSYGMESAIRRWEVAGPNVCKLIGEYKEMIWKAKHHEDYPAFQKLFFADVAKLFNSLGTLFEDCLYSLRVLKNVVISDDTIERIRPNGPGYSTRPLFTRGHGLLKTHGLILCILEGSVSVIQNSGMFVLG